MEKLKLKEQVEVIREGFGYVNRFKGQTFVICIDSILIGHQLFALLIKDIVLLHQMGIRVVLVPGARTRIDEVLSTYKIACETVDGVRVTSADAIPFIKMAAFDVSNKIMTMLAESNTTAVIGNWVKARSIGVRNGTDYQHSGIVEKLKTEIINNVLEDGLIPIFPNIGWNTTGRPYNISSLELAYTLSIELKAAKLFFCTDIQGLSTQVLKSPKGVYVSSNHVVSQLTVTEAAAMIALNKKAPRSPQYEMLNFACKACQNGVDRVHIINGTIDGMILKEIFSNRGLGTMIYGNEHDNIRPMTYADIPMTLSVMQPFVDKEILVKRSAEELEKNVDSYIVYEVDGIVHASGALLMHSDKMAEIAAIAVDELYTSLGIGKKIISYLIEKARDLKQSQIFILTTQTIDWFLEIGFKEVPLSALPESKKKSYNKERNSKILMFPLKRR